MIPVFGEIWEKSQKRSTRCLDARLTTIEEALTPRCGM
jgi:hypothetical protein